VGLKYLEELPDDRQISPVSTLINRKGNRERGKEVFITFCSTCHRVDGMDHKIIGGICCGGQSWKEMATSAENAAHVLNTAGNGWKYTTKSAYRMAAVMRPGI